MDKAHQRIVLIVQYQNGPLANILDAPEKRAYRYIYVLVVYFPPQFSLIGIVITS
jgi:hypothetical protein